MAAAEDLGPEPFYHGTRADLKPGDLIEAGYTSNFGKRKRAVYVYMTGTLEAAIWGAELALGEGRGRVYTVEPTGPIVDDPDLTDKRFPGNPTKSYCSREALRVTGEVTDWQGHSPEALKAMKDVIEQNAGLLDTVVAAIPGKAEFDRIHDLSDDLARQWASDAEYLGCMLLMIIRGTDVRLSSALDYRSRLRGETHTIRLPRSSDTKSASQETPAALSGRVTDVTGWREGWAAALESCATEIGLASEVTVFIAVDADHDKLTFLVNADAPGLSWHRDLRLVGGVLSDRDRGEMWHFEPGPS